MDIVHVSPEFAPLIKAGGLGDVVFSLTRELSIENRSTTVILPYYSTINELLIEDFTKEDILLTTPEGNALITWEVYQGFFEGISLFLLKPNHPKKYFDRGVIYGEVDDNDRFILFSCAAALLIEELFENSIVHLHDWQTAVIAPLLFEQFPIVFTIHNFSYQGECSPENLERVNLEKFLPSLRMQGKKNPYLLKGGIEFSGAITTVSPSYAEEIQTEEYGCGFESLVSHHAHKLVGILNGLDLEYWNPNIDQFITRNYTLSDPSLLALKEVNKRALFDHFKKPYVDAPLVCSITRLVPQKGPELIEAGIHYSLATGSSFALSGVPCDVTERQFEDIQKKYASHPQALFFFGFDESLAHLIYAAADYILIPSHFEPCGLTQMISLLYGTLPIVTATGGLKDTITDIAFDGGNGIVLADRTPDAVREGIKRAREISTEARLNLFSRLNPERFSWKNSLSKYISIYESFVSEPL